MVLSRVIRAIQDSLNSTVVTHFLMFSSHRAYKKSSFKLLAQCVVESVLLHWLGYSTIIKISLVHNLITAKFRITDSPVIENGVRLVHNVITA